MKQLRLALCSRVLAVLATLTCAQIDAASDTVRFYNWYQLIDPQTLQTFERQTGTRHILDTFASIEIMLAKVMTGGSGYDLTMATDHALPALISAGALQKLDTSKLKNWQHLDPDVLDILQANDPGNHYAVPYLIGTTGIGYNAELVARVLGDEAPVDSWDLIFKEENIAKLSECGVAMLDSAAEIMPIAMHYLGLPDNSEKPEHYAQAQALLMKIRPHVRYFDSSKFVTDLINGELCAVITWSGGIHDARRILEENGIKRDLRYRIPKEGAPIWTENLVMLKDAGNPQASLALIDHLIGADVATVNSTYLGYPNANSTSRALLEPTVQANRLDQPSPGVMNRLFPLKALPHAAERIRTRAWSRIKTGS
ncbi:extracellular solute-binding protein [Pseudomonas putida]|uniref:extracellular solute-binding protein n=1 Tax=Pseudomonas putida TaxID=303 RepID=UPI0018D72737|nr:extracellular solute-binding protein [Pseudomonas putida]MBH3409518.1 extracellular solute-binding protein [Pseudomonas putida]